jgi:hypothetical protein
MWKNIPGYIILKQIVYTNNIVNIILFGYLILISWIEHQMKSQEKYLKYGIVGKSTQSPFDDV